MLCHLFIELVLRLPSLVLSLAEKKKTTTLPAVAFLFAFLCGGVATKKVTTTFSLFKKNKKMLIALVAFFDGFTAKKKGWQLFWPFSVVLLQRR
jgi:hypothetical protein